ncbi:hypothetical protein [Planctomycetes bacterium K23_9]|uniref:Uncharacterized protein n=1 Tax=Stieleria marina TaxID=1930275 RepID=A0A517NNG2_9BACT|nr:hypothetical protein K239x_06060 [Planctomycetes bacterium K23_9]
MNQSQQSDGSPLYSTWLLERLFTGNHRKFHSVASQVLGLLGVICFAWLSSALFTLLYPWLSDNDRLMMILAPWIGSLVYVSVLFALLWIASCPWLFTARLALIYATIFGFINIVVLSRNDIEPAGILLIVPFAIPGFIQYRRGWTALAWGKYAVARRPLGIVDVMDATASIALTLAITQASEFELAGALCLIPASMLMMTVGFHVWGRLQTMASQSSQSDQGRMIWGTGCVICGTLIFLMFAMASRESPVGLMGIPMVPITLLSMHYWSALVILWLRWCGWKFEKYDPGDSFLSPINSNRAVGYTKPHIGPAVPDDQT